MTIDRSDPAFPTHPDHKTHEETGMSLRDAAALKVLPEIYSQVMSSYREVAQRSSSASRSVTPEQMHSKIAKESFAVADAFLKEREK